MKIAVFWDVTQPFGGTHTSTTWHSFPQNVATATFKTFSRLIQYTNTKLVQSHSLV